MARVRKYPTICYLVVSIIPLIPGASLYYTMQQAVDGAMDRFVSQGLFTAEVTGIMAASIILISSLVRMFLGRHKTNHYNSSVGISFRRRCCFFLNPEAAFQSPAFLQGPPCTLPGHRSAGR